VVDNNTWQLVELSAYPFFQIAAELDVIARIMYFMPVILSVKELWGDGKRLRETEERETRFLHF